MRLEKLPKVFLFLRLIRESFGSEQKEKRLNLDSDPSPTSIFLIENNYFKYPKLTLGKFYYKKMEEHVNGLIISFC